jgi:LEA14-like dessication related protein
MYRSFILGCCIVGLFTSCENKQKAQVAEQASVIDSHKPQIVGDKPIMKFEQPLMDFGKITEGDSIVHYFKFTNVGKEPLVINTAQASCGCTIPAWPKKPIQSGERGEIKVVFNSKHKKGIMNKTVTIYANTQPENNQVSFRVEVLPKGGGVSIRQ